MCRILTWKCKHIFKHLDFFLKWNIIVTASYGIGYDCWPDQCKKSKGWGLGARRLATHTHTHTQTLTLVSQAELLNESEVWPPAKIAIRPHKWGTFIRPKSRYVTWCFQKIPTCPVRSPTSLCSDCKKVWKARATSARHGIKGRVESPCWKTRCPWM